MGIGRPNEETGRMMNIMLPGLYFAHGLGQVFDSKQTSHWEKTISYEFLH